MPDESEDFHPSAMDAVELPGGVRIAAQGLRFAFSRSGGPGGQNVNKVNTKAELWINPAQFTGLTLAAHGRLLAMAQPYLTAAGEIHFTSGQTRSQEQNRAAVIEKLRHLVGRALIEPKRRKKMRPTRASKERRLTAKRLTSQRKVLRRGSEE